ncbi:hypothetical protein A988_11979 [Pseudomonas syringae BRIP39023]|nr:hypothetical protein A988_11979 [Pseudomonas syringae BRIP39023]
MAKVREGAEKLASRLNGMPVVDIGNFLKLDVLSEVLDRKVGQVGRYERGVFVEAFKVLIEDNFEIPNMEPCWRAS